MIEIYSRPGCPFCNKLIKVVEYEGLPHLVYVLDRDYTREGLIACKDLSDDGIQTNVTLCFSVAQAAMASIAGATYISPFVGRLNDNSFSGVELVRGIADLYCTQSQETKVLAASLRDVHHVSRCFLYGASVATLPTKVFDKMYNHVLTDAGLAIFEEDFKNLKA